MYSICIHAIQIYVYMYMCRWYVCIWICPCCDVGLDLSLTPFDEKMRLYISRERSIVVPVVTDLYIHTQYLYFIHINYGSEL